MYVHELEEHEIYMIKSYIKEGMVSILIYYIIYMCGIE